MKLNKGTKILFALFGIFLVGMGVAFNNGTLFGNDPIGILYDAVRNVLGWGPEKLGLVSNIVNYSVIGIMLIVGRRYLNIGTLIYIIPFGWFVGLGSKVYSALVVQEVMMQRVFAGVAGCAMVYIGVAFFIAMDIGLDPFTGVVMVIRDKIGWDFKKTKICFDIILVIVSTILGGKLGVITFITAFTAGPCIQFATSMLNKVFVKEVVS